MRQETSPTVSPGPGSPAPKHRIPFHRSIRPLSFLPRLLPGPPGAPWSRAPDPSVGRVPASGAVLRPQVRPVCTRPPARPPSSLRADCTGNLSGGASPFRPVSTRQPARPPACLQADCPGNFSGGASIIYPLRGGPRPPASHLFFLQRSPTHPPPPYHWHLVPCWLPRQTPDYGGGGRMFHLERPLQFQQARGEPSPPTPPTFTLADPGPAPPQAPILSAPPSPGAPGGSVVSDPRPGHQLHPRLPSGAAPRPLVRSVCTRPSACLPSCLRAG